jgi:hypothetical protein
MKDDPDQLITVPVRCPICDKFPTESMRRLEKDRAVVCCGRSIELRGEAWLATVHAIDRATKPDKSEY